MCLNQRSPQLSYWGFDLAIKRWSWILGGHSPHQATHLKSMSQQLVHGFPNHTASVRAGHSLNSPNEMRLTDVPPEDLYRWAEC